MQKSKPDPERAAVARKKSLLTERKLEQNHGHMGGWGGPFYRIPVKKEEKERWAGDMDRKKRRGQTHTAYMQIVNTKTTTERVIGARGQRTTMEVSDTCR